MKYYFIVGEASGDMHAANLMKSLKHIDSTSQFKGFGGDKMQAGLQLVKHYKDSLLWVFWEVIKNLSTIRKKFGFSQSRYSRI